MSTKEQQNWQDEHVRIGLHPRLDSGNAQTIVHHSFKEVVDIVNPEGKFFDSGTHQSLFDQYIEKGQSLDKIPNLIFRQSLIDHALGICRIKDEANFTKELERRFAVFGFRAFSQPNITVTAEKPLIIGTAGQAALANYGTVTMEPGGYIEIRVPCAFTAQKIQRGTASGGPGINPAQADFIVTGTVGSAGQDGHDGTAGLVGGEGSQGGCDCCGGIAKGSGGKGGTGGKGVDGEAGSIGGRGGSVSSIRITIKEMDFAMTFVNIGGAGGAGGDGGNGGAGGQGGHGGPSRACEKEHTASGDGGNGGDGGTGGNGGNGGDGGDGGNNVILSYASSNQSKIIVSDEISSAGKAGVGGNGGRAGKGGPAGGGDTVAGGPGKAGEIGKKGTDGVPGNQGKTQVVNL